MKVWFFNLEEGLEDDLEVRSRPLFSGDGVSSAGEGSNDILPYSVSGPNSESCSASSFFCLTHLPNHADLFRKQAGTSTGQTGPGSGHTESWLSRFRDNQNYAEEIVTPKNLLKFLSSKHSK